MSPAPLPYLQRQGDSQADPQGNSQARGPSPWVYSAIATLIVTLIFVMVFRAILRRLSSRPITHRNPSRMQARRPLDIRHHTGPFPQQMPYTQQVIHVPAPPGLRATGASYILLTPNPSHNGPQMPLEPGYMPQQGPHVPRYDPNNLPSFEVPKDQANNPCPICLAPLKDEPVSSGQCLHMMHTSCLKSWLAKDVKSACPVCRESFLAGDDDPDDESVAVPDDISVNTSTVARSSVDGGGVGAYNPHMVIR